MAANLESVAAERIQHVLAMLQQRVPADQQEGLLRFAQPYLDGVDEHGETALLYIGGEYSHAIRKDARLGLDKHEELVAARAPTVDELELAEHVLDTIPFDRSNLLYARVDLIPGPGGEPLLLELELTEPSLFLSHAAGAPERMAAAIAARL